MIFAELDGSAWAMLLTLAGGMVTTLVLQVVKLSIDYFDRRDKRRLEAESVAREFRRDEKLTAIVKQTNGILDSVAESSRTAGEATGELRAQKEAVAGAAGLIVAAAVVTAQEVLDKAAIKAEQKIIDAG